MVRIGCVLTALLLLTVGPTNGQDRQAKQRARFQKDREQSQAAGNWIYNDLEKGFREARTTGKPLLLVFR